MKKTDKQNTPNENTKDTCENIKNDEQEITSAELQKIIDEKQAEIDAQNDKFLRLAAEYDNFKKRTVKEKEMIYTDAAGEAIAALLPIIDNLSRALSTFSDTESEYYKGIELVLKQTMEIFQTLGVEEIKAVGEQFDPEVHNAVMHIEDDSMDENIVAEEFQKGYKYKDKVLRYSMVKVAN